MKQEFLIITFLIGTMLSAFGQFAPPAGQLGSTAIHKDSSIIIAWANACTVVRGYQNIADTSKGKASSGDSMSAVGKAGTNGVVSLGDGGVAVLQFAKPIKDGPGPDFAVFENSFSDDFLELAFVEVSTDGINYFRFDAISEVDTSQQMNEFALMDATKVHNFAGKYRANYGVPFDLSELDSLTGLDIMNINYVRIIDVVGSLDDQFASHDSKGKKVNDPWPTVYPIGGFDLDAVGVIHQLNTSLNTDFETVNLLIRGNQVSWSHQLSIERVRVYDLSGKEMISQSVSDNVFELNGLQGIYVIQLSNNVENYVSKLYVH